MQKISAWGCPVNPNEAEIFLLSCLANRSLKAKFHYAVWFEAGSKLIFLCSRVFNICDLGAHVGADALCLCVHNSQYSFFVTVLTLSISEIFEC